MSSKKNNIKLSEEARKLLDDLHLSEKEIDGLSAKQILEKMAESKVENTHTDEYPDIFHLIFNKGILLMAISDFESKKIVKVNEEFINTTGYLEEEIIGKSTQELGLVNKEQSEKLYNEIIKNRFIKDAVIKIIKKDKSELFCNFNGQFFNYNGKKSFLAVIKDITKYKNAEEKLNKERKLLNTVLDNLPVAVYLKDKTGSKVFVNKCDLQNIGKSKEEILGKTDLEIFDTNVGSQFYKDDKLVLEEGKTILNKTEKMLNANGQEKWLLTSKVPLYDINNNIEGLVGIGLDITEKKKADDELKKYREHLEFVVEARTIELKKVNENLEREIKATTLAKEKVLNSLEKEVELNKMRSKFISTTSHEFKTPLTTVLSSTELIEIYLEKGNEYKVAKHIERIKSTVEYLDGLINDVLLLNKTETGRVKFTPETISLRDIINEIILKAGSNFEVRGQILYTYNIDEKKLFTIDKQLIEIALTNLITNACKYSPEGGKINIDVSESKGFINIDIADGGIGIAEKEQHLIFNQFYRGSNSENSPGTGLGLAIVKKAVELHNGTISVSSKVGVGSTFTISIPSEVKIG